MNASKFNRIVDEYRGTVTGQDDQSTRVEFPNYPKAAGFYDQMIGWGLAATIKTGDTVVIVQI